MLRTSLQPVTGLGEDPATGEKQRANQDVKQVQHSSSLPAGEDDVMAFGPQHPCQPALPCKPPASLAPDNYQGLRLEYFEQRLPPVAAETDVHNCFQRPLHSLACQFEKAMLDGWNGNRWLVERQPVRHDLRSQKGDPSPEVARQRSSHL